VIEHIYHLSYGMKYKIEGWVVQAGQDKKVKPYLKNSQSKKVWLKW
jgi:hypothetical protein